ncbi:MAG: dTDP-4-dehydrorhamnose reductase [Saprospiraceae bacterium]
MKVLVTGSEGQLAREINQLKIEGLNNEYEFFFFNKQEWDITNEALSNQLINHIQPNILINTAAYTKVDQAEIDKDLCFNINSKAPALLARICKPRDIKFFHFSSDYVFNGQNQNEILFEDSPKNPKGIYAESKSLAENLIIDANPEAIIIRSSWIYSSFGNNFVKTMLRLAKEKTEIRVVNDQIGSPTYAFDLAKLVFNMISSIAKNKKDIVGLYHYSNEGSTSWFDFASEIFLQRGVRTTLIPISTLEFNSPAPRPAYSVLNCNKIKLALKIEIPFWKDSLKKCLQKLQ